MQLDFRLCKIISRAGKTQFAGLIRPTGHTFDTTVPLVLILNCSTVRKANAPLKRCDDSNQPERQSTNFSPAATAERHCQAPLPSSAASRGAAIFCPVQPNLNLLIIQQQRETNADWSIRTPEEYSDWSFSWHRCVRGATPGDAAVLHGQRDRRGSRAEAFPAWLVLAADLSALPLTRLLHWKGVASP